MLSSSCPRTSTSNLKKKQAPQEPLKQGGCKAKERSEAGQPDKSKKDGKVDRKLPAARPVPRPQRSINRKPNAGFARCKIVKTPKIKYSSERPKPGRRNQLMSAPKTGGVIDKVWRHKLSPCPLSKL